MTERRAISSGSTFEDQTGCARAVIDGDRVRCFLPKRGGFPRRRPLLRHHFDDSRPAGTILTATSSTPARRSRSRPKPAGRPADLGPGLPTNRARPTGCPVSTARASGGRRSQPEPQSGRPGPVSLSSSGGRRGARPRLVRFLRSLPPGLPGAECASGTEHAEQDDARDGDAVPRRARPGTDGRPGDSRTCGVAGVSHSRSGHKPLRRCSTRNAAASYGPSRPRGIQISREIRIPRGRVCVESDRLGWASRHPSCTEPLASE